MSPSVSANQSISVHVTGTNNGTTGLRSWLVDASQTTLSNVVATYVGAGLPAGSFTLDYTLTATNPAGFLFYKGPTFDTEHRQRFDFVDHRELLKRYLLGRIAAGPALGLRSWSTIGVFAGNCRCMLIEVQRSMVKI